MFTYFPWEDGEKLDHFDLALSLICITVATLVSLIQYYAVSTYFEKQKGGKASIYCHTPYIIFYCEGLFLVQDKITTLDTAVNCKYVGSCVVWVCQKNFDF